MTSTRMPLSAQRGRGPGIAPDHNEFREGDSEARGWGHAVSAPLSPPAPTTTQQVPTRSKPAAAASLISSSSADLLFAVQSTNQGGSRHEVPPKCHVRS